MNYDDVKNIIVENAQILKSLTEEIDDENFRENLTKLRDESIDNRLENVEKLLRLKSGQVRIDEMINQKAAESSTAAEFLKKVDGVLNANYKRRSNVKTSNEYKNLKEYLLQNSNSNAVPDGEDISMVDIIETGGSTVAMHDPWTKMLMVHPVRNTKCGHHYERDTVNSIIKDHIDVRCPVVGCASKAYIHPDRLLDDFELLRKIKAFQANQDAQYSDDE